MTPKEEAANLDVNERTTYVIYRCNDTYLALKANEVCFVGAFPVGRIVLPNTYTAAQAVVVWQDMCKPVIPMSLLKRREA